MPRPRNPWVAQWRAGHWYARHTKSRVMYPAESKEHATRLARALNLRGWEDGVGSLLLAVFGRHPDA